MKNITLETDRLLLCTSDRSMMKDILAFHKRNEEHLQPWEAKGTSSFYTKEYHKMMLRAEKRQLREMRGIDFWLFTRAEWDLVGKIAVFNISMGNYSNCVIGYKLDKDNVGKGYMYEALHEVIRFIFEVLNLHRIEINIMPRNTRSINVVEKLGFEAECVSKKFVEVNGVWEDHLRFVRFNDQWKER